MDALTKISSTADGCSTKISSTVDGCSHRASSLTSRDIVTCSFWACLALVSKQIQPEDTLLGLARTVYGHRIWPYVWWFPCSKYRMYTVYTYVCMVLANPTHFTYNVNLHTATFFLLRCLSWFTYSTNQFLACPCTPPHLVSGTFLSFWVLYTKLNLENIVFRTRNTDDAYIHTYTHARRLQSSIWRP